MATDQLGQLNLLLLRWTHEIKSIDSWCYLPNPRFDNIQKTAIAV
jgi:hypothetical protein